MYVYVFKDIFLLYVVCSNGRGESKGKCILFNYVLHRNESKPSKIIKVIY